MAKRRRRRRGLGAVYHDPDKVYGHRKFRQRARSFNVRVSVTREPLRESTIARNPGFRAVVCINKRARGRVRREYDRPPRCGVASASSPTEAIKRAFTEFARRL